MHDVPLARCAFGTGEAWRDEEISPSIDGRASVDLAALPGSAVLLVVFIDSEQTIHLGTVTVQLSLGVKKSRRTRSRHPHQAEKVSSSRCMDQSS
jgi:hypothetical protein